MTLSEFKEVISVLGLTAHKSASDVSHPFKIGAIYLIRTVTMIDTGRLVEVTPTELVLEDAAWIADTGRFADAVRSCVFGEVEPFPAGRVIVGRGALIDAVEIAVQQRQQI
jgi:hypothetical protein